jgi:F-type H+-transporting ATPase subunit O
MIAGRAAAQAIRAASLRAPMAQRVAIRSYAQAAAASSSTSGKPPVPLYGVDGTYASALVSCFRSDVPLGSF